MPPTSTTAAALPVLGDESGVRGRSPGRSPRSASVPRVKAVLVGPTVTVTVTVTVRCFLLDGVVCVGRSSGLSSSAPPASSSGDGRFLPGGTVLLGSGTLAVSASERWRGSAWPLLPRRLTPPPLPPPSLS